MFKNVVQQLSTNKFKNLGPAEFQYNNATVILYMYVDSDAIMGDSAISFHLCIVNA